MRLSTTLIYQNGLNGILNQEATLSKLQQQLSSGKRFLSPADDPLAASLSVNLSQTQSVNKNYSDNRAKATTALGLEENALSSIVVTVQNILQRIVEAGNGTMSDADRQTLVTALKGARDQLVGLANTTDGNGQYLFSGYQGFQIPYLMDPTTGQVTYKGDTGQRNIQVEQARQIASGDIGSDIFGKPAAGALAYITSAAGNVSGVKNLGNAVFSAATFDAPTPANNVGDDFQLTFVDDSVRVGAGNAGTAAFEFQSADPTKIRDTTYTVDFDGTEYTITDGDGNTVAGSPFAAVDGQITFDGVTFNLTNAAGAVAGDTWTLDPGKLSYGVVAIDRDNAGDASVTLQGADMAQVPAGSNYAITYDGATNSYVVTNNGAAVAGSPFAAADGPITFDGITLDLSGAASAEDGDTWKLTFGDYTDGGTIEMGGVQTRISGTPVAGDSFSFETPSTKNMDMFANLNSLIDVLDQTTVNNPAAAADIVNRLATVNKQLSLGLDNILTVRASVGSRLNELDALNDTGEQKGLSYKKQMSDLEDVDVYQVTSDLLLRKVALDAASSAFKIIQGNSLFSRS